MYNDITALQQDLALSVEDDNASCDFDMDRIGDSEGLGHGGLEVSNGDFNTKTNLSSLHTIRNLFYKQGKLISFCHIQSRFFYRYVKGSESWIHRCRCRRVLPF